MANSLVNPTVAAILGPAEPAKPLQLWAGVNLPLALSVATFVLGFTIYFYKIRLRTWLINAVGRSPSFDNGWDNLLSGLLAICKWQTKIIQTGVLRRYMFVTFATALAAMAGTLMIKDAALPTLVVPDVTIADWLVFLLVLLGTALTAATDSRIAAIAGLGVVGIGIAMIFILYSAPDVAITQLLVEALIVVLFAAAALRLPGMGSEPLRSRPWDAALAIGLGVATTAVLLMVTSGPIDLELTTFFQTASWPEAFGQNIVNVILVDFRALDTFGEIAVVLVAAISIFALLKSKPEKDQT